MFFNIRVRVRIKVKCMATGRVQIVLLQGLSVTNTHLVFNM